MTIASLLLLALGATSPGSAVAVPNVVDQYTELPPGPGGEALPGEALPLDGNDSSNAGPIAVQLPDGRRAGELDEDVADEARAGQVVLIGASNWRIQKITGDRVIVTPAPGAAPQLEGVGQEQVTLASSSLGVGFPILLIVAAAVIAALAYGSRRSTASTDS